MREPWPPLKAGAQSFSANDDSDGTHLAMENNGTPGPGIRFYVAKLPGRRNPQFKYIHPAGIV